MDDLRVSKICADFHICVKYSLSQYADNSGELGDTAHPKLENSLIYIHRHVTRPVLSEYSRDSESITYRRLVLHAWVESASFRSHRWDMRKYTEAQPLTSSPEVTEMMFDAVYSVEISLLGLDMWRNTLPWTMALRMKLTWPMTMRVNPFFISRPGPFCLSRI